MPSCAARCDVTGEFLAEGKPTVTSARCAQTMTMPSRMSNRLLSVPSVCSRILPSVSTPSTSKRISLIRDAFACVDINSRVRRSKHFRSPEVVEVYDSGDAPGVAIDDRNRRNLPLLHDVERFGCQRRRWDRHWSARHDIGRRELENAWRAIHVPPQVAVGNDAQQRIA